MPLRVLRGLRSRGPCLLVIVLAMDHGSEAVTGIALDTLPYVQHRAASRVHHDAANLTERLEIVDRYAKCRQDHHIRRLEDPEIEAVRAGEKEFDPHIP